MGHKELIKPGLIVKVILHSENKEDLSNIKGSIIHEVTDDQIIISQTEPPISENRLGETMAITFVNKEKTGKTRYKILTKIEGFINSYTLSSQEKIHAILLKMISKPEIFNIRMSYRVELPNRKDLEAFIYKQKINLIDISMGGARLSINTGAFDFDKGNIIKVTLMIDKRPYDIDARILRIWSPQDHRYQKALQFVALEFLTMSPYIQNILSRKLIEIQRDIRYKELFNL